MLFRRLVSLITLLSFGLLPLKTTATPYPTLDFTFNAIDGTSFDLKDHRGKAILIVNTASRCGFTAQYSGLQRLWENYQHKGLIVVAVPSNDFGGQEPLEGDALKKFCEVNYNVTFPIMDKINIKGENAHPFYAYVSNRFGFSGSPKWNFHKYLINSNGELVDWFSSITSPDSEKLINAIEAALPQSATMQHTTAVK
jgi:glutathione peroxidase